MAQVDDIYKILIDYIQDDNRFRVSTTQKIGDLKTIMEEVRTQTTKTNGRVTKLEGAAEVAKLADQFKKGKTWVIIAIATFVLSIIGNIFYNVVANIISNHLK